MIKVPDGTARCDDHRRAYREPFRHSAPVYVLDDIVKLEIQFQPFKIVQAWGRCATEQKHDWRGSAVGPLPTGRL